MYRIVLDPTILFRGLLNPHSLCGRLLSQYTHRVQVIFSAQTMQVVATLLMNNAWAIKFPSYNQIDPSQVGRLLCSATVIPIPASQHRNPFVAVAIAANADYLVCEHPLFLELRDAVPVKILDTRAFITLLEAVPSPPPHSDIVNPGEPTDPRPSTLP